MREIAAPFATKLTWVLAAVLLALLHEKVETVFTVGYSLLAHAAFHWFQIRVGSHGGVDDRNISLLEMASSPSNVVNDAIEGDAMPMGIISTFLVLGAAYRCFILRRVQSAWRALNVHVNQHVVVVILLGFIKYGGVSFAPRLCPSRR